MKRLVLLAALALAGCSSLNVTTVNLSATRAATVARASHAFICGGVETTHASGVLTGDRFNRAKALCIQADDVLDVADAALIVGQDATAAGKINEALNLLDSVTAITKGR